MHRWVDSAGNVITSYESRYNGAEGVGTNRQATEELEHFGRTNTWELDFAYRMLSFDRAGVGASF